MQDLTLIAILDAEKGHIQCRFVKVTRSQRMLEEHAKDNYNIKQGYHCCREITLEEKIQFLFCPSNHEHIRFLAKLM